MRRFGFEGVVLVVWKGETSPPPGGGFPFLEGRLLGMGKDLLLGSPLGELAP